MYQVRSTAAYQNDAKALKDPFQIRPIFITKQGSNHLQDEHYTVKKCIANNSAASKPAFGPCSSVGMAKNYLTITDVQHTIACMDVYETRTFQTSRILPHIT